MRFKLFGIRFFVSFPAIALICVSLFMSDNGSFLLLMCMFASALHEAGHLIFICRFKGKPQSICIYPSEIAINSNLSDVTNRQDLIITIAGVGVNLFVSAVCIFIYSLFSADFIFNMAICNLFVGLFNLLPIKTFDGGQLIELLFSRFFSTRTTERIINIITVVTVIPLATAGLIILFVSPFNYSMLMLMIYYLALIISKEMR